MAIDFENEPSKTIMNTERLILRELVMGDLPAVWEIVGDDMTMSAWNGAWSEEENLAGLEKQINNYREHGFGRWAVVLRDTGQVIGICGLQYCDTDKDSVLEVGYLFNRSFWHKGYAIEAAIASKSYAFDVLEEAEVFSLIRDTNLASINVAIRNGMLVRGRFIKQYKGAAMPHYIFPARKTTDKLSQHHSV